MTSPSSACPAVTWARRSSPPSSSTTGAKPVDLAAVRAWCEKRLARYALPAQLVVLTDLPRSQVGKVLRRVVREHVLTLAPSA